MNWTSKRESEESPLRVFVDELHELSVGDAPGMTRWRKRLFVATASITADAAEYFRLPRERVVIMGSQISV